MENNKCECGICGLEVKPGNRFIKGHARKGKIYKRKISRICKCGCGEITKPGNKFINRHSRRGVKLSEETKKKIGLIHFGKIISEETKLKISTARKDQPGPKPSAETRRKMSLAQMGKKMSEETKLKISIGLMKCRTDGYCDVWSDNEYKEDIRNNICSDCGMTIEESLKKWNRVLDLHHKDGNKKNCHPDNFDTLCCSCHAYADLELRKIGNILLSV